MDRSASRAMSPVSHPSPTVLAHFIGLKLITSQLLSHARGHFIVPLTLWVR